MSNNEHLKLGENNELLRHIALENCLRCLSEQRDGANGVLKAIEKLEKLLADETKISLDDLQEAAFENRRAVSDLVNDEQVLMMFIRSLIQRSKG